MSTTQEDKYYTPELSEFYIGLEYTSLSDAYHDIWSKEVIRHPDDLGRLMYYLDHDLSLSDLRVKKLDHEDILSLGWTNSMFVDVFSERGDDHKEGFGFSKGEFDNLVMFHDEATGFVQIYSQHVYNEHSGNWTSKELFQGTIKNKSRLYLVMEMLGIEAKTK